MRLRMLIRNVLMLCAAVVFSAWISAVPAEAMQLARSLLCESVEGGQPRGAGVIFSRQLEQLSLYTRFEQVETSTHIFHRWYRRDHLMAIIKLAVRKPGWATYSTVQLRNTDLGPWRVEIVDASGDVLKTLRFSIVE